jgi:hypothetical protein
MLFKVRLGSQNKEEYMPLLQFEAASSNMMPVQRAWWQGKQEATFSKRMNGRDPRNSICSGSRHSGHTASHSYCPVTSINPRSDRHRILRPCYLSNTHRVLGSNLKTKYKFKGHPQHLTTQTASGKRIFDSVAYINWTTKLGIYETRNVRFK